MHTECQSSEKIGISDQVQMLPQMENCTDLGTPVGQVLEPRGLIVMSEEQIVKYTINLEVGVAKLQGILRIYKKCAI